MPQRIYIRIYYLFHYDWNEKVRRGGRHTTSTKNRATVCVCGVLWIEQPHNFKNLLNYVCVKFYWTHSEKKAGDWNNECAEEGNRTVSIWTANWLGRSETKIVYPRYDEHFSMSFLFNFFRVFFFFLSSNSFVAVVRTSDEHTLFLCFISMLPLPRCLDYRNLDQSLHLRICALSVCLMVNSLPDTYIFFSRHEFGFSSGSLTAAMHGCLAPRRLWMVQLARFKCIV